MACSRPCPPLSFCHDASSTCKACASICDAARPNQYEPVLCHEQCREYVYEQLKAAYSVDGTARLLGGVGLALSVVAVVVVLAVVVLIYYYVFRRPRRLLQFLHSRVDVETTPDMKAKVSTNNNKHSVPDIGRDLNSSVHTVSGSVSEAELRLHGTTSTLAATQPSHAGMGMGGMGTALPFGMGGLPPIPPPVPARHPSEDSTLDYAAYDNPGLSPSSSPLPPSGGSAHATKAMDAVLDHVATLPGAVAATQHRANHYAANDLSNGPRMESSF